MSGNMLETNVKTAPKHKLVNSFVEKRKSSQLWLK